MRATALASPTGKAAVAALALAFVLFPSVAPGHARAQGPFPTDDFSALTLRPTPSQGPYLTLESTEVIGRWHPTFLVGFDYGTRPLVAKTGCPDEVVISCDNVGERVRLVSSEVTFHFGGAIAIADRVEIGVVVPVALVTGEDLPYVVDGNPVNTIRGGTHGGVADPMISARARLLEDPRGRWAIGGAAFVTLPIGHASADHHYIGDVGPDIGLEGIGEARVDDVRVAVNLGGEFRPAAATLGLDVGTMLTYGAGVAWRPPLTMVGAFAELEGATAFGLNLDQLEARAGGRFYFWDLTLTGGIGAGLIYGPGVPGFRTFITVSWSPAHTSDDDGDHIFDAVDSCPTIAEDLDQFADEDGCPESDNDGDRIPDRLDRCPDQPEDLDDNEDADGCPDGDNDGDGIVDGYDSCPSTPEDMDGDRDRDGCPESDRDRDGVDDQGDRCPDQPEDTDGFADDDGCPETDADGDHIRDDDDECPEDAETRNGNRDRDGCPEDAAGNTLPPTQHRPAPGRGASPGTGAPGTPGTPAAGAGAGPARTPAPPPPGIPADDDPAMLR